MSVKRSFSYSFDGCYYNNCYLLAPHSDSSFLNSQKISVTNETPKEQDDKTTPCIENDSDNALTSLWDKIIKFLLDRTEEQIVTAYFSAVHLTDWNDKKMIAVLELRSQFLRDHIEQHYIDILQEAFSICCGVSSCKVDLRVNKKLPIAGDGDASNNPNPSNMRGAVVVKKDLVFANKEKSSFRSQVFEGSEAHGLNKRYTFDSFVVGSSNQFSHAAALQVAHSPGTQYNPLFIYGGVGLGKTHLLHAIGNSILSSGRCTRVMYLSAEEFMNGLIQALRTGRMEKYKEKLRSLEVLLVDDIQFISGKERTQEEFFHTFNTLYNLKHQIVVSCDKIPQEISGLEDRLKTRFAWGLLADLQTPDFETRVAILRKKAAIEGVSVDDSVLQVIAENVSSNVRELEGAFTRVVAVSSLQSCPISAEFVMRVLEPILKPKIVNITVEQIRDIVAQEFGLKISELVSKRRTRNLSFPRHIAMYLSRKFTTSSYPDIGSKFGGRDHTSVIHAANVVAKKIDNDPEVKATVEKLERRLG